MSGHGCPASGDGAARRPSHALAARRGRASGHAVVLAALRPVSE